MLLFPKRSWWLNLLLSAGCSLLLLPEFASAAASITSGLAGVSREENSWALIGEIRPRSARELGASSWSIGGETLDRDFAVYANYKAWLGPLGAKAIRLQAGWAKCERKPGEYHWGWLDEVVNDALVQGVQPWLQASYGNPIYEQGGGIGLGAGLPSGEKALAAWDAWVRELVRRYRDRVSEWEIWNEPDLAKGNTPEAYSTLFVRTAQIIRAEQPSAKIYALALAGNLGFAEAFLKNMFQRGKADLVTAVTIHGYPADPDDTGNVDRMRALLDKYAPAASVRQGETGAPSGVTVGALRDLPWTENTQAKWDLRRMLSHAAKNVPFNLFTLCELKYDQPGMQGINRKGLLIINEDKSVIGAKMAYKAAQNLFAIFDSSIAPAPRLSARNPVDESLRISGFRHASNGGAMVAVWQTVKPGESNDVKRFDLRLTGCNYKEPVYVDLRLGQVRSIPAGDWLAEPDGVAFRSVPVYDSPVLLAERSLIPITSLRD